MFAGHGYPSSSKTEKGQRGLGKNCGCVNPADFIFSELWHGTVQNDRLTLGGVTQKDSGKCWGTVILVVFMLPLKLAY